jgi:hypothetical protein
MWDDDQKEIFILWPAWVTIAFLYLVALIPSGR